MTRSIIILAVLFTACSGNAPIPSPPVPGNPCGNMGTSCGSKMCCDRPFICAPHECIYGGGDNGDLFGARKSVPQRPEE